MLFASASYSGTGLHPRANFKQTIRLWSLTISMCDRKESQGPKSCINTHALRHKQGDDRYTYIQIYRFTSWYQCTQMRAWVLAPSTYVDVQLEHMCPVTGTSAHTHTRRQMHMHALMHMYTPTQLGSTSAQTQKHTDTQPQTPVQQVVLLGGWVGLPSPEVSKVLSWALAVPGWYRV